MFCWPWVYKAHVSIHRKSWVRVTSTQNCGACVLPTVHYQLPLPVCSTLPLQYRGSAWATSGSAWRLSWTLLLLSLSQLRSLSPSFRHQTRPSKKVSPLSLGQVEFSTGSNSSIFSPSEAPCLKAPLWIRRLSFMSRDSGADGLSRSVVCRQTCGAIGIQWAFPSAVGGRSLSGLLLE